MESTGSTNSNQENISKNTKDQPSESLSKKLAFQRKPSIKKKGPEVKQTLTSYRRMLKANPLLRFENEGKDAFSFPKNSNSEAAFTSIDNRSAKRIEMKKPLQRTQSLKVQTNAVLSKKTSLISGNIQGINTNKQGNDLNISRQSNIDFNSSHLRILSSTRVEKNKILKEKQTASSTETFSKPLPRPLKRENNVSNGIMKMKPEKKIENKPKIRVNDKKPVPLRRSLSAQHFNRNKEKQFKPSLAYTKADRTQSLEEVSKIDLPRNADFSPIFEENRSKETSFVFKTPSAYERRSVTFFTPRSVNRRSMLRTSTPSMPTNAQLQDRLNDWLKKRGKSLSSFHHLKCFGIHLKPLEKAIDEEDKENVEVEIPDKGSYEDLYIEQKKEEEKMIVDEVAMKLEQDPEVVALEALSDLLTLIKDGYPREQCEAWLGLIKEKYRKLEEQSLYWECRAAIEQSIGNIGNAVECYKTAIVQGAEIQNVDKSLDQLLQKFSLLNINTNNSEDKKTSREKEKIIREARNVFKSSIIQFAVQERKLKKKNSQETSIKLVATPVRRSTRLSRSGYVRTPGVQICSSLQDLKDEEIDFHKNDALC